MERKADAQGPKPGSAGGVPWKWVALGGAAVVALGVIALVGLFVWAGGEPALGDCVAIVKVSGEIITLPSGGLFDAAAGASSESIVDDLSKVRAGDKYKAVLLDINSPGGSAVASKQIYDEIVFLQNATAKPVVAYLGEEAASGGYYVASAADEIVADPNALTGSIGARFSLLNYGDLFGKLGIRQDEIKSGALKDIGSPTRNLTEEERQLLQDIINETAQNFYDDVRWARRNRLVEPYFSQALDARILSPKMALRAGLVDAIGSKREALRLAAEMANMSAKDDGDPQTCDVSRKTGLAALLGGTAQALGNGIGEALGGAIAARAGGEAARLEYR